MFEIIAPEAIPRTDLASPLVFLAGSIEQGRARNWQYDVYSAFEEVPGMLLNPRRPKWTPLDQEKLKEQIEWELDGLERADVVFFYFDPDTKSPVSMLELGLYVKDHSKRLVVCCPEGFWRRENVEITCRRYQRRLCSTFEEGMAALGRAIRETDRWGL